MLLQVHDELVFDVFKDELEMIKPVIIRLYANMPWHYPMMFLLMQKLVSEQTGWRLIKKLL